MKTTLIVLFALLAGGCKAVDRLTTGALEKPLQVVYNTTKDAGEMVEDLGEISQDLGDVEGHDETTPQ